MLRVFGHHPYQDRKAHPEAKVLGAVEKVRQRRSRPFGVLTYYEYAPRAKPTPPKWLRRPGAPAALPVEGRVLAHLGWAGQTWVFLNSSLAY